MGPCVLQACVVPSPRAGRLLHPPPPLSTPRAHTFPRVFKYQSGNNCPYGLLHSSWLGVAAVGVSAAERAPALCHKAGPSATLYTKLAAGPLYLALALYTVLPPCCVCSSRRWGRSCSHEYMHWFAHVCVCAWRWRLGGGGAGGGEGGKMSLSTSVSRGFLHTSVSRGLLHTSLKPSIVCGLSALPFSSFTCEAPANIPLFCWQCQQFCQPGTGCQHFCRWCPRYCQQCDPRAALATSCNHQCWNSTPMW